MRFARAHALHFPFARVSSKRAPEYPPSVRLHPPLRNPFLSYSWCTWRSVISLCRITWRTPSSRTATAASSAWVQLPPASPSRAAKIPLLSSRASSLRSGIRLSKNHPKASPARCVAFPVTAPPLHPAPASVRTANLCCFAAPIRPLSTAYACAFSSTGPHPTQKNVATPAPTTLPHPQVRAVLARLPGRCRPLQDGPVGAARQLLGAGLGLYRRHRDHNGATLRASRGAVQGALAGSVNGGARTFCFVFFRLPPFP